MKKLLLLSFAIIFSFSLSAQGKKEVKVSEKIKAAFSKLYPEAKDVKWIKNAEVTNASFFRDGKQIAVTFRADTLFVTMVETGVNALPKPVSEHFVKYYKNFSIVRAGEVHFAAEPDKKNICYGAEITDGKITKRIICYPDGSEFSASNLPPGKKE